jgi:hypothetical protein
LCRDDVQRCCACQKHSGQRESHSGLGRKPSAFPPESLFAFSPESCSSSPRNRFHVRPGILFALLRNPQGDGESIVWSHAGHEIRGIQASFRLESERDWPPPEIERSRGLFHDRKSSSWIMRLEAAAKLE